jgi:HK97 family phage major capsid protein
MANVEAVSTDNSISIEAKLDKLEATLEKAINTRQVNSAPFARVGENIMNSRPFSYAKCLSMWNRNAFLPESEGKIEADLCNRLTANARKCGYHPTGNNKLVPIWADGLPPEMLSNDEYNEIKSILKAPVPDHDQVTEWRKSNVGNAITPALSAYDQQIGGSLIGPPRFEQPIDLLRNSTTLFKCSDIIPLGLTGQVTFPALTQCVTANWVPENTTLQPSVPQTASRSLKARKSMGVVAFSNESLRFSNNVTEQMVRKDLFQSVTLNSDYGFLFGAGTDVQPLGLFTMLSISGNPYGMGVVTPTASNQLAPQDAYQFEYLIEQTNATGKVFLMNPAMAWAWYQSRWNNDGIANQGGFVFDFLRNTDGKLDPVLAGLPIIRSNQIPTNLGNGSQTNIACIGGPDGQANSTIGLFGAVEWLQTDQGAELLASDASMIRCLMFCDWILKYPSSVSGIINCNVSVSSPV